MKNIIRVLEENKKHRDASRYYEKCRVLDNSIEPKITVGIVGDTGCGKSSVINALLDEERLVLTSCM